MTDRELLERAAKAAGYTPIRWTAGGEWPEGLLLEGVQQPWNPLASDGDALRLAVKLRLVIEWWKNGVSAESPQHSPSGIVAFDGDPGAATRRAIVRAAAAIGEQA